jgi:DNA-binding transcriptional ArsR family regulator
MDPTPTRIVLDARSLRALAHPVRVKLLFLLRTGGPSTATLLAARLGLTSGATSYHLRQLGEVGIVVEDTGRGNARERWWRAGHDSTELNDPDLIAREPGAAFDYLRSVAAMNTMIIQESVGLFPALTHPWQEAFSLNDWKLRLTPAEATRLGAELAEVVARYRVDMGDGPPGAAPVTLMVHVLPRDAT